MTVAISVDTNNRFELGGETFVVDNSAHGRRPSDDSAFTVVKGQAFLNFYSRLAARFRPRTILELGIFQGGSFVVIDKLFEPQKMTALDIAEQPVAPLMKYIERTPGRSAHFAVSQTDASRIGQIVRQDLGGRLDMVVDDASHDYELTKRSFEILFPILEPGGHYLIEDWAWAHAPSYQGQNAHWSDQPALTNLLFELIALLGSTADIAEIQIVKGVAVVRKGADAKNSPDVWQDVRLRDKPLPKI